MNWVKTWLALTITIIVLLSANALAVTITEGVTTTQDNAPLQTQQSANPVLVDTGMTPLTQQGSGDTGSVTYLLSLIEPEQAINENKTGVPINGPNPTVLIPPPPSQPSEGQPSVGIPHGYITIPWWLIEFIQDNWWLLLLLIVLIIALYLYMKHREGVSIEIELPKWAY
uniref:Uncharacterized protein n=1 Tax=archaeon enrichment culture clone 1(2010) TaxID=795325 RepID=D9CGE0_9ARCH|nr:hypothetical protein pHA1_gp16 [archaeon enrichment culture clone 1(2010)]